VVEAVAEAITTGAAAVEETAGIAAAVVVEITATLKNATNFF
jgi:hypothetical protein